MDPERFVRIERLFFEASRLPPADRAAFLAAQAGDDPTIVEEVTSLLEEERGDLAAALDQPAMGSGFTVDRLDQPAPPIERIGQFRIIGILGEGGMGVVYEAEQDKPRRRVALKVVRSALTSRQALKRFEHEAQVLGRLTHPGIARIYEAGEASTGHGRQPFFAMELVRGRPITEYAAARGLGVREKMELVARICDAVQHAHQHGVVHRDLKPANVLVTDPVDSPDTGAPAVAEPKILDFGVARLTDADLMVTTMQTASGQIIGTLPYMSPEQVHGDPSKVDARSDVYALGVLMHELLSGRLPYDLGRKSLAEAARTIREHEPGLLGSIDRNLRGDPETIAAKALEKEASRRYQSASELGADIRRWLADQPITARPPSAVYQMSKFVRRNRALVTGAAIALVAILIGAAVAVRQAVNATRERDVARSAQRRAEGVRDFLVKDVFGRIGFEKDGPNVKAGDLLRGAGERVSDRFSSDQEMLAEVEALLGQLGSTIGDDKVAEQHGHRAVELAEKIHGAESPEALHARIAWTGQLVQSEDGERAKVEAPALVAPVERVFGVKSREALHARINAAASFLVANTPQECATRVDAIVADFGASPPDDTFYGAALNLAVAVHRTLGQPEEALKAARRAFEFAQAHEPPGSVALLDHRMVYGQSLWFAGHPAEAEPVLRAVLDEQRKVYAPDDTAVANTEIALASACEDLRKLEESETFFRDAIRIMTLRMGEDHWDARSARSRLYWMLDRTAQREKQVQWIAEELARFERFNKKPDDIAVLDTHARNAALLLDLNRLDDAEREVQSIESITASWTPDKDPQFRATTDILAGRVLAGRGKTEDARAKLQSGLAVHDKGGSPQNKRMAIMARRALDKLPPANSGD